jgi:(p)ppGpp synthase/HD superfamily hydrolase
MAQNDIGTNIIPWTPIPTLIPSEWQIHLAVSKTKGSVNYIAGMHYDRQGTVKLLREWGLPWIVVVAGAFLFHEEKELRNIAIEDRQQFLSHIQQARRYIDCIEDDDLSTLLSSPYDDLGALLIAVAVYYAAIQGLAQRKNKRSINQHELSRIESIGTTLIHITKQVNLWLFKRDVEDLMLQLCAPIQYMSIKEELQKILQRDEEKLRDFCRAATVFCHRLTQIPISITYAVCGVEGFSRRRQVKQTTTTSQEAPLTGFDLVIFDVIVPTLKDCYEVFGALNHLGYQGTCIDRLANPKLNGSSYLSFNIIIKQESPLQHLTWLVSGLYTCHIQIATHPMHAVTNYGCLYPACYKLYVDSSLQETKEKLANKDPWSSEEGNIYTSIIESFKRKQVQGDAAAPITVYDKRLRPFSFPKGATVLDFAYAYDENLTGYVYGFINDREVPLYRKLNAGDIIDIKTSNAPQTHEYWVERKYVTTSRALNAIQQQRFYEHKGYILLRQKLEYYRYKLTEDELSQELYDFVRYHHLGTVNAYLQRFNEGADLRYTPDWAAEQIMQQIRERNEQVVAAKPKWVVRLDPQFADKHIYYLPKSFCNVCQPTYPRDGKIVGYVSQREKTLVIHSAHCPRLMDRHHKQRTPLYPLTWHLLPTFRVGFSATAHDRRGFILDVSKQLRHHQCSLVSIYAEAVHKDAQLRFVIETYDTGEVLDLLQKIKKVENIIDIDIDPLKTAPHVYEQLQHLREQPLLVTEKIEAEYTLEEAQIIPASRRPMLRNPFNISRPPGEKMFFGRTPEIKKLQRELCADERGKAIFLYGPRRSGKSSLCNHFLEHYVYPPYWYVYHSLQGATRQDEATILMQIAEEVSWIFQEHFNQKPPAWHDFLTDDPQVRLKRVLQKCLSTISGARLVLVLDEFGGAIEAYQKKFLDGRFFTYWRNLMSDVPQLSLIFVLPTIPHNFLTSGQLSGAFSFMEAHSMEFLDEESARQLLVNPLQEQNIVIHPGTIKRILDLTGCNPYYLTLVGAQLISQLNLDPNKCLLNDKDLEIVVDRLVKGNTKQNFYFYHDELHAEEIPIVKAIVDITQQSGQPAASLKKIAVRLQKPIEVLRPHLKRLQEGLILREQGAQWTSSQPYYAFTIELVRLWMTQNNDFFLPSDNMEGSK